MKIVINKTKRLLFVGGTMIKPGTNVFEDGFDTENKEMNAWAKAKMVSVKDTDKMSDEDFEDAIEVTYDNDVLDVLKNAAKSKKVKEAADRKKADNDKKEAELDAALEDAKKAGKKAEKKE